jgi:hypothetical protein
VVGRTAERSRDQGRDAFPQHSIGGKADRVREALGLQELVYLRRGDGGTGAEVTPQYIDFYIRIGVRGVWNCDPSGKSRIDCAKMIG